MKWQNLAAIMAATQLMAVPEMGAIGQSKIVSGYLPPKDKKTKHRRAKNKLAKQARKNNRKK